MRAFLEIASVLPVIDGVGDKVGGDDGTKHVDLLRNPTGLHLNVPPVPQPTYNGTKVHLERWPGILKIVPQACPEGVGRSDGDRKIEKRAA